MKLDLDEISFRAESQRTAREYASSMQTIWRGRLSQAAAKYGEQAPNAAVCCNACRTCVQTNLLAAGLAAVAALVARFTNRAA
jgi:hypothetical protein